MCVNCWNAFSLHPISGKKRRWRKPTHFGGASRSLKVPPPKLSPYVKGAIRKLPPVKVHIINPALDTSPPRHSRPQVDHFDVQRYHQVLPIPPSASPTPPPPRLTNVAVTSPDLACSASRQWVPLSQSLDISGRLVGYRLLTLLPDAAALTPWFNTARLLACCWGFLCFGGAITLFLVCPRHLLHWIRVSAWCAVIWWYSVISPQYYFKTSLVLWTVPYFY